MSSIYAFNRSEQPFIAVLPASCALHNLLQRLTEHHQCIITAAHATEARLPPTALLQTMNSFDNPKRQPKSCASALREEAVVLVASNNNAPDAAGGKYPSMLADTGATVWSRNFIADGAVSWKDMDPPCSDIYVSPQRLLLLTGRLIAL